jgi:antitoxin ParD1/3/4
MAPGEAGVKDDQVGSASSAVVGRQSIMTMMAVYGNLCHHQGPVAMASMNVSVPDPMRDWVQDRVDSGQYASVSDYVRDLIRRDQAQANEKDALIAALVKGEQSGKSARSVPEIFAAVERELRSAAK